MDSGNITETANNETQPAEGVPANAEEQAQAQSQDSGNSEYVVEIEGDQQEEPKNGGMTLAQTKAAWNEEREKRKKKNKQLEDQRLENERLRNQVNQLEESVGNIQRGKRPDPDDYIGDYEGFYKALDDWQGKSKAPSTENKAAEIDSNTSIQLTDDQAFHAHHSREELKKAIPDYDKAEESFKRFAESRGLNPDDSLAAITQLSYAHDIDYAKAMYALHNDPVMRDKLAQADQMGIVRILNDAAKKVTVRKNTPIDTKPEHEHQSTGSVGAAEGEVNKAWDEYKANPTAANHKKYQQVKKKFKQVNENG